MLRKQVTRRLSEEGICVGRGRATSPTEDPRNVGLFEMRGDRDKWSGLSMTFAGATYFGRKNHYLIASPAYRLHNRATVNKVRFGNF